MKYSTVGWCVFAIAVIFNLFYIRNILFNCLLLGESTYISNSCERGVWYPFNGFDSKDEKEERAKIIFNKYMHGDIEIVTKHASKILYIDKEEVERNGLFELHDYYCYDDEREKCRVKVLFDDGKCTNIAVIYKNDVAYVYNIAMSIEHIDEWYGPIFCKVSGLLF